MATYALKARHDADQADWIAAITAAALGKKTYTSSTVGKLHQRVLFLAFLTGCFITSSALFQRLRDSFPATESLTLLMEVKS